VCLFERLSSLDFQKPTITCSSGLVIHSTENLSTLMIANILFCSISVYSSQHFIKWMLCLLYSDNSLHYPSFNLIRESRVLLENFSPPPTTLLRELGSCFQDSDLLVFDSFFVAKSLILLVFLYGPGISYYDSVVFFVYLLQIVVFVLAIIHSKSSIYHTKGARFIKSGFFKLCQVKPNRLIVVVCLYHFVLLFFNSWSF
jgi:hypothetical protein